MTAELTDDEWNLKMEAAVEKELPKYLEAYPETPVSVARCIVRSVITCTILGELAKAFLEEPSATGAHNSQSPTNNAVVPSPERGDSDDGVGNTRGSGWVSDRLTAEARQDEDGGAK